MSRVEPRLWGLGVWVVDRQLGAPRDERSPQPYWHFNQKQLAVNQTVCRQRSREAFHPGLLKICKDWNADLADIQFTCCQSVWACFIMRACCDVSHTDSPHSPTLCISCHLFEPQLRKAARLSVKSACSCLSGWWVCGEVFWDHHFLTIEKSRHHSLWGQHHLKALLCKEITKVLGVIRLIMSEWLDACYNLFHTFWHITDSINNGSVVLKRYSKPWRCDSDSASTYNNLWKLFLHTWVGNGM